MDINYNSKTHYVHTLVLETFYGEKPTPLHTCDHKNGNSIDNQIDNLRWATRGEQLANRRSL